jgi:hypothetical protein
MARVFFGGAAGNRTPVRRFTDYSSTGLDCFAIFPHNLETDQIVG